MIHSFHPTSYLHFRLIPGAVMAEGSPQPSALEGASGGTDMLSLSIQVPPAQAYGDAGVVVATPPPAPLQPPPPPIPRRQTPQRPTSQLTPAAALAAGSVFQALTSFSKSCSSPSVQKCQPDADITGCSPNTALSRSSVLEYVDNGFYSEAFAMLYEFFKNGTFCDIEITVGKTTLGCHRLVLMCFSAYFRMMFASNMSETRSRSISIKDIDEYAFIDLVHFAYTSRIVITTDNVQTLLYACSILQVESVERACCRFMISHLEPSNCIGVRNFADRHGQIYLVSQADAYILEHFSEVLLSEELAQMSVGCLKTIITSLDLNVRSEVEVYEAVLNWIRQDEANNIEHLSSLMSCVRMPLLPTSYLIQTVCNEVMLRQNLECRDLLDEARHYQLSLAQVIPQVNQSPRMLPRKSYAGVIFCVGGRGASGNPFKTIECYDLRRDRWFPVAEMSTRRRHVGVVTVNGKLYAVGGHDGSEHLKSGEVFDPQLNKWQAIASMNKLRRGIALAYLNGPIYAVGGLDDLACFNTVERYDPATDAWTYVQSMIYSRGGVAVAAFRGCIYAMGGNNGTASLESCERYDPHLNKWSVIQPMNKRRAGAGVAELNGYLYVVGGFDDNSPLDCVERYDPVHGSWTMVSRISCPRGGVGIASLGGKLYAVGGHDGTNYLSSVEEYDPETDRWSSVANIGTCRAGAGVAVVACYCDDLRDAATARTKVPL